MSSPRFFCPPPLPSNSDYALPPAAAHHASRVLRLRIGDAVQIFDGLGNALDASLIAINGKQVLIGNLHAWTAQPESSLPIILAQAMCSSEKMDWVVQKATELGVTEIIPVQTQRSVAKLTDTRAEKRTEHWRNVAIAACEQSGQNRLPTLNAPFDFNLWLADIGSASGTKYILLPDGAHSLQNQPEPQGRVILLVGPEGGFTVDEALIAQQAGFVPILLGPRVLRTETAALACITAIQVLWGDFK
jgi:16S rRNA (uracil1498-N3)-methyltransferase